MSGEERGGIKAQRDMPQLAEKGIENGRAFCQVFRKKTLKKSRDREGGTGGCLLKCCLKRCSLHLFPRDAGKSCSLKTQQNA